MKLYGWHINLSGNSIPVYEAGMSPTVQKGTITKNECFCEGSVRDTGFDGWDYGEMVLYINTSHEMTPGMIDTRTSGIVFFGDYASNGTSWVKVNTLKRKVVNATVAYDKINNKIEDLPAGSYVWLSKDCSHGDSNLHYIQIDQFQKPGQSIYNYAAQGKDYGFIDLTGKSLTGNVKYWLNVGSIILRQA